MTASGAQEQFVRQLTEHQRRLYTYILTLLGRPADADDVLQETNVVMWRKAAEFEPGTSFSAWALRIAYFEVLAFRKRQGRNVPAFDTELVEQLAGEVSERLDGFERRRQALASCLQKLPQRDRDLITRRYQSEQSVGVVAEQVGRSVQATYQVLHRIRGALLQCIERTLAAEEHS